MNDEARDMYEATQCGREQGWRAALKAALGWRRPDEAYDYCEDEVVDVARINELLAEGPPE